MLGATEQKGLWLFLEYEFYSVLCVANGVGGVYVSVSKVVS